jgi:uncharacterized protein (PEP-CTERM system associated)
MSAAARPAWRVTALAGAALLCAGAAGAQSAPPVVTVGASVSATDNAALAASAQAEHDVVASVRPALSWSRRGSGLEIDVDAAVTLLGYARGTRDNTALPDLRATLKSGLVEGLLFLDASAQLMQAEADPFASRVDDGSTVNRRTQGNYRVSPYLEHAFSTDTALLLRHDASMTTNGAGAGTRLRTDRSVLRLTRKPVPLGLVAELTRVENDAAGAAEGRFTLVTARLQASHTVGDQLVVGAVVGQDRSHLPTGDFTDGLAGLSVQWMPTPRTDVSAVAERRFFGTAGTLAIRHRMPFLAFAVNYSREPTMTSPSLGIGSQGADIRNFLDAILTTRYPEVSTRSGLVSTLVTGRGIDVRLTNPIEVVAGYPQLQTTFDATVVLLGGRNLASLTLYSQTVRVLSRDGQPTALVPQGAVADNRQHGASLQLNRQLSATLTGDVVLRWSKVDGLAARDGDRSEERIARVSLMRTIAPRTTVSVGVQHDRFETTVAGRDSYRATSLFVGLAHRF